MDRFDELTQQYAERSYGVTNPEARRIHPRYNLVAAILEQVERLDPDHLPATSSLAGVLMAAADAPQPTSDDVELQAVLDERERFRSTVRVLASRSDLQVAPLGHRRVLTADESAAWRTSLQQRWGVQDAGRHPMLAGPIPPAVLTYTGAEGLWTGTRHDWIAYASHENTVAFGGALADALTASWPDLDKWRWPGWDGTTTQDPLAVIDRTVRALNVVNARFGGAAYETGEREQLCQYLEATLEDTGLDVDAFAGRHRMTRHDITDQWRTW